MQETIGSIARARRWSAAILGAALLAAAAPAVALTEAELDCQDAIALAARNYFKARYSAISKCENERVDGSVPLSVDCRPKRCSGGANDTLPCADDLECPGGSCLANPGLDAHTGDKLTNARDTLETKIGSKCSDPLPAAVVLGAPCDAPAPAVADVADCISDEVDGVTADRLIDTIYDGTGTLSTEPLLLCQTTIAKEARKFVKKRQTRRRKCANKFLAGKIAGPCPDEKTRQSLDKDLDKFRSKVLPVCSDALVLDPTKEWGFPCERTGAVTFANLTFDRFDATLTADDKLFRCVAAAAAGDADVGADVAYPLGDAAPFSYGVAAGDQTPTAFIAWTRTDGPGNVTLTVATNEDLTGVVATLGPLTPDSAADNVVKVDVTGLTAGTRYYYQFAQGAAVSRVGRVRTAVLPSSTEPVQFVWTGDANAFFKPFTVLDGVLRHEPDLFLFIGDTIYGDDERSGTGEAITRADYHVKYKENRSDRALRNAMAWAGTVSIWDDHEVTNDFYGTNPDLGFQAQMADGNQAFRDYLPMREDTGDPTLLYRSFQWGQAAEFFLIDDRQYRDAQAYVTEPACLSMGEPVTLPAGACVTEINNPARTYLGATQKQWLKDGLLNSTATFKFIMNGPLVSSLLFLPYDRWEGYAAERNEILDYIRTNDIKNVFFLSTDIHALIVNDEVRKVNGTSDGPPVIQELVSGAIGMDPIYRELPASIAPLVPTLPTLFGTISYFDIDRFNYGFVEVTTTEATVTYRDGTGAVLKEITIPAVP